MEEPDNRPRAVAETTRLFVPTARDYSSLSEYPYYTPFWNLYQGVDKDVLSKIDTPPKDWKVVQDSVLIAATAGGWERVPPHEVASVVWKALKDFHKAAAAPTKKKERFVLQLPGSQQVSLSYEEVRKDPKFASFWQLVHEVQTIHIPQHPRMPFAVLCKEIIHPKVENDFDYVLWGRNHTNVDSPNQFAKALCQIFASLPDKIKKEGSPNNTKFPIPTATVVTEEKSSPKKMNSPSRSGDRSSPRRKDKQILYFPTRDKVQTSHADLEDHPEYASFWKLYHYSWKHPHPFLLSDSDRGAAIDEVCRPFDRIFVDFPGRGPADITNQTDSIRASFVTAFEAMMAQGGPPKGMQEEQKKMQTSESTSSSPAAAPKHFLTVGPHAVSSPNPRILYLPRVSDLGEVIRWKEQHPQYGVFYGWYDDLKQRFRFGQPAKRNAFLDRSAENYDEIWVTLNDGDSINVAGQISKMRYYMKIAMWGMIDFDRGGVPPKGNTRDYGHPDILEAVDEESTVTSDAKSPPRPKKQHRGSRSMSRIEVPPVLQIPPTSAIPEVRRQQESHPEYGAFAAVFVEYFKNFRFYSRIKRHENIDFVADMFDKIVAYNPSTNELIDITGQKSQVRYYLKKSIWEIIDYGKTDVTHRELGDPNVLEDEMDDEENGTGADSESRKRKRSMGDGPSTLTFPPFEDLTEVIKQEEGHPIYGSFWEEFQSYGKNFKFAGARRRNRIADRLRNMYTNVLVVKEAGDEAVEIGDSKSQVRYYLKRAFWNMIDYERGGQPPPGQTRDYGNPDEASVSDDEEGDDGSSLGDLGVPYQSSFLFWYMFGEDVDEDAYWKDRFEDLRSFKEEHGHARVPPRGELGAWAAAQRQVHREVTPAKTGDGATAFRLASTQETERIKLLDEIGFDWAHFSQLGRNLSTGATP